MSAPIAFKWTGTMMEPLRPKAAQEAYEVGAVYWLEEIEDRSWASHRQFFAWLNEAWLQLPEDIKDLYPSINHLRKRALINAGWHRESVVDAGSRAAALRVAAYCKAADEFAYVVTRGPLVVIRKARSQAMHGHDRMTKREFAESKQAVMEVVAKLIGVSPEDLGKAA